jgi:hypothetical protein
MPSPTRPVTFPHVPAQKRLLFELSLYVVVPSLSWLNDDFTIKMAQMIRVFRTERDRHVDEDHTNRDSHKVALARDDAVDLIILRRNNASLF